MVGTILVTFPADAGRRFVSALREELELKAAFWLYFEDADEWRLVLATNLVTREGPRKIYQRLQEYLADHREFDEISISNIALRSPNDPQVKPLREAYDGVDLGDGRLIRRSAVAGNSSWIYLEDAYIYFAHR